MKIVVHPTPDDWDSDNISFIEGDIRLGSGFKGKNTGRICITRCPMCRRENYGAMVTSGYCAWCNFNPNITSTHDREQEEETISDMNLVTNVSNAPMNVC